jgi:hypothetical protein
MISQQRAVIVASWEEWRRALYEERAAMHEYLAGMSREDAERMAYDKYKPEQRIVPEQRRLDL